MPAGSLKTASGTPPGFPPQKTESSREEPEAGRQGNRRGVHLRGVHLVTESLEEEETRWLEPAECQPAIGSDLPRQ